jgi:hypothetical protein
MLLKRFAPHPFEYVLRERVPFCVCVCGGGGGIAHEGATSQSPWQTYPTHAAGVRNLTIQAGGRGGGRVTDRLHVCANITSWVLIRS